jgi:hypothetical protein
MSGKKYAFNRYRSIEVPELDAFTIELTGLCERYGIGFDNMSHGDGEGCSRSLIIIPFEQADFEIFTGYLKEYKGGVPWLNVNQTKMERTGRRGIQ